MPEYTYNIVRDEGELSSVTVLFRDAEPMMVTSGNPRVNEIVAALEQGASASRIRGLMSPAVAISQRFARLSERVLVSSGRILFDGDEVHNALAQAIVAFYDEGQEDFKPLLAFMEKVGQNPNPHSREHLFRWLEKHRFSLAPDGDFLAYKGVDGTSRSKTSGPAIVNGEFINGHVLNAPDTVVEIARSQVVFDPQNGCAVGLHAGNYRYAREFAQGGKILAVKINPRDVVSVPVDSNDEKLRVCRYRVVGPVTEELPGMLHLTAVSERTQRVDATRATAAAAKASTASRTASASASTASQGPGRGRKGVATKADRPEGAAPKVKFPRYYEQFEAEHFEAESWAKLRWLAKEWGLGLPRGSKRPDFVAALVNKAQERQSAWNK